MFFIQVNFTCMRELSYLIDASAKQVGLPTVCLGVISKLFVIKYTSENVDYQKCYLVIF